MLVGIVSDPVKCMKLAFVHICSLGVQMVWAVWLYKEYIFMIRPPLPHIFHKNASIVLNAISLSS